MEGRVVLEHVSVGVDDGVAEVGSDVGGGSLAAHGETLPTTVVLVAAKPTEEVLP